MFAKISIFILMVIGGMTLIVSCGKVSESPTGPEPNLMPGNALSLYDTLVVAKSNAVFADTGYHQYVEFDMSNELLVLEGNYDDIIYSYLTFVGGERSHYIYDFNTDQWNTFIRPWSTISIWKRIKYDYSLRAKGMNPARFVNGSNCLWMTGDNLLGQPDTIYFDGSLTIAKYHSNYHPTYLIRPYKTNYYGLLFNGDNYFISEGSSLHTVSLSGEFLEENSLLFPNSSFTGYDGQTVWINKSYSKGNALKYDFEGNELCNFSFPFDFTNSVAVGNNRMWVYGTYHEQQLGNSGYIYEVDIDSSCTAGEAQIIDSVFINRRSFIVEWSDKGLLVFSDSLMVLSYDGELIETYPLPVGGIRDVDYRDGILHFLCAGPKELGLDEQLIVRFRLP